MDKVEIIKIICLLFIGGLLMWVVSVYAWAKGYKDGARETRDFYLHMNLKKDDEKIVSNNSVEQEVESE